MSSPARVLSSLRALAVDVEGELDGIAVEAVKVEPVVANSAERGGARRGSAPRLAFLAVASGLDVVGLAIVAGLAVPAVEEELEGAGGGLAVAGLDVVGLDVVALAALAGRQLAAVGSSAELDIEGELDGIAVEAVAIVRQLAALAGLDVLGGAGCRGGGAPGLAFLDGGQLLAGLAVDVEGALDGIAFEAVAIVRQLLDVVAVTVEPSRGSVLRQLGAIVAFLDVVDLAIAAGLAVLAALAVEAVALLGLRATARRPARAQWRRGNGRGGAGASQRSPPWNNTRRRGAANARYDR